MMEMDEVAYHLTTPSQYQALLEESSFSQIEIENATLETVKYSQENIDRIETLASTIKEKYGQEVYDYCIESWSCQRDAFASEELGVYIVRAKKS